ncbi:MAG: ATP-binding protein [Ferruginibacter sp.]
MRCTSAAFYCFVLFLLCIAIFAATGAQAQLNSGNLTQYSEKDGLPGSQVNNVITDRWGYIWMGTVNGLARYDGYEFKRFYLNPNDSASIHGLVVWSLFEDHKGTIWVGTSPSYLNAYDPVTQKFRQYNFTGLIDHAVNVEMDIQAMCEDNNGRIYFGVNTFYGDEVSSALLYKDEKNDQIKKYVVPDSLKISNVLRIANDKIGNIFLLTYSGIFKIDTRGKLISIHDFDKVIQNRDYPTDIAIDTKEHLWLITHNSMLYDLNMQTGNYRSWPPDTAEISREFNSLQNRIKIDKADNIWMTRNNGVRFFNTKTEQFSQFNNGAKKELEHLSAVDFSDDDFGNLWIGTYTSGLIKYEDRPQLKSYSFNKDNKKSLTQGWANFIFESSDGKIWITTGGQNNIAGLNILDIHTGINEPIPYSGFTKRSNGVSAIWENVPGEMYLAMNSVLYAFSTTTHQLKQVKLPGIPDSLYITWHFKDSRNNEWLCSFRGLYLKAKDSAVFKRYDLSKVKGGDAGSNNVTMIYESKKNGLWILTDRGLFLYHYDAGTIERLGYDKAAGDIFVTQDVNSFYEDAQNNGWVGTWQGGLSRYNIATKKIKTFTINDGLPSMSIQSILADEKNNTLWLSTFEGLCRFNLNTGQCTNFTIADGLQSQLFADNSALKTSTGFFAFGGSNGVTIFNPGEISKNSMAPKIFFTDFKLFNKSILPADQSVLKKPINETELVTLAHDQNNISLNFIALHYSNSAKNRYAYKMENYDNEWRDVGNLHEAFYPNLPPGKYTFRVKAASDKGVWNEEGATLHLVVLPPWWKTTWAYVLYGILFIVLAFAIDRYVRQRLIQKERERNSARELEQAKEIQKAYYKLEESHETLKATQAQLVQSEKMASLGELTAGIAHEIQNPLNFVNNFSEVNTELLQEMKQELDKGNVTEAKTLANDVIENEQKINHHGKRADAIVKGMLQHSRSNTGIKEPTDLNALADEYLRLSYHGLRAKDKSFNATIKTDFDASIGNINIVPQDIARVILNMLTNAFYAVNEKKEMGLAGYEPTVSISTKNTGDHVEIKVMDNGNGIPQKVLDKIFQPFFTTKPTGQGTGLGLSLSYDIIKAHGGEIKVETKEREGTRFVINLPVK